MNVIAITPEPLPLLIAGLVLLAIGLWNISRNNDEIPEELE